MLKGYDESADAVQSMRTLPENLICTGSLFWPMRRMLVLSPERPAFTFSGYTPSC